MTEEQFSALFHAEAAAHAIGPWDRDVIRESMQVGRRRLRSIRRRRIGAGIVAAALVGSGVTLGAQQLGRHRQVVPATAPSADHDFALTSGQTARMLAALTPKQFDLKVRPIGAAPRWLDLTPAGLPAQRLSALIRIGQARAAETRPTKSDRPQLAVLVARVGPTDRSGAEAWCHGPRASCFTTTGGDLILETRSERHESVGRLTADGWLVLVSTHGDHLFKVQELTSIAKSGVWLS